MAAAIHDCWAQTENLCLIDTGLAAVCAHCQRLSANALFYDCKDCYELLMICKDCDERLMPCKACDRPPSAITPSSPRKIFSTYAEWRRSGCFRKPK
jgi:hypothetical protein